MKKWLFGLIVLAMAWAGAAGVAHADLVFADASNTTVSANAWTAVWNSATPSDKRTFSEESGTLKLLVLVKGTPEADPVYFVVKPGETWTDYGLNTATVYVQTTATAKIDYLAKKNRFLPF